jgi:predicted MFS family arabinose efflux permease
MNFNKACLATRLMFLIPGITISSWAPMIPFVKENLDLNEAGLGLVLLVFGLGALFTMPLTGWLVHRFGSRTIILSANFFSLMFLPLLTIVPSITSLSIILFLFGASSGAVNVSVNSHAILVESKSPKPLMSGFHCLFSFGGLLGAGLLSILLGFGFELHAIAMAFSLVMFLLLLSQYRYLYPKSEEETSSNAKSSFSRPSGKVMFIALLCFVGFLSEGAVLDWSAVFLQSSYGYEVAMAGIGYAVFSVAMSVGRLFGDKVVEKMGSVAVVQLGGFMAALGYILTVTSTWGYLELVGFVLVGLGGANIVPILFSAAGRQPDTLPSVALTMVTTMGYAGILLGPAIVGFVAQQTSLTIALAGIAFLLLILGASGQVVQSERTLKVDI